jgi:hypothetical protein
VRVLRSVLVALLGAVVGLGIGLALTYALLSGQGEDALVWGVTGIFFCVPCTLGGGIAAGLLCRRLFPGVLSSLQELYGIGAAIVVLVVAPVTAIFYPTSEASVRDLSAGTLCTKPGIRYIGTTAPGVTVCFTLTADRRESLDVGWDFGHGIGGCGGGGSTALDWKDLLASPGQIYFADEGTILTGTIRGARASGVLVDPHNCGDKKFKWTAREVAP